MGNVKTYKVTGMDYYKKAIKTLAVKNYDYGYTKKELEDNGLIGERVYQYEYYPIKIELVPEPTNPHDPNAIKVIADGVHVGYIKRGSCAHLLKVIAENRIEKIDCEMKGGKYKVLLADEDDYEDDTYILEKGDAPISVHLFVTELNR